MKVEIYQNKQSKDWRRLSQILNITQVLVFKIYYLMCLESASNRHYFKLIASLLYDPILLHSLGAILLFNANQHLWHRPRSADFQIKTGQGSRFLLLTNRIVVPLWGKGWGCSSVYPNNVFMVENAKCKLSLLPLALKLEFMKYHWVVFFWHI